ncbi:MAG: hypothetical protein V2G41_09855 [bacterium JZ-2024 1]
MTLYRALKALGVSHTTIYHYIQKGILVQEGEDRYRRIRLRGKKVDGKWEIPDEDVAYFKEAMSRQVNSQRRKRGAP